MFLRSFFLSFAIAVPLVAAEEEPKIAPELAAMKYRSVGPFAGGRVSRACGVVGDPLVYYAATASGGVWKSADGGLTWKPIFDDQPTSSIGSIAVAPSDPNVVYLGTGEANIRGNVSPGAGIFKSEDAGKTWKHVWKERGQIGTIAVHPKNAEIAYAAVLGHAFGPNKERGIYRTTDGGTTWEQVLKVNEETGASDVAFDPNNPRILFAGFWQTRRRPWEMTSGGPGSDLFVSRDSEATWTSLKKDAKKLGLPEGLWGKVGVAVAPSNSQRIYASIEAEKGGLFRSDDGGEHWSLASDDRNHRQRAWYYSTITVHPTNPDIVYLPNVNMQKSIDGGKTFKKVTGIHHGDHHDIWLDPKNPERMISSNDGGVDLSADGGKTWIAPPLPISQFYHVHADTSTPYRIMGCMQDLGTASGPSNSLKGNIHHGDWSNVGGGETGSAVPDPNDPNIVYAGEYGGIITRYDRRTGQARSIAVNQWNPSGIDPAKHEFRFQWTAPIVVSQHTGAVYHAGNVLFRTTDAGLTWTKISPDLTRNDKQKQQWSGGPITGDNTGAETYCTIFALAESPKKKWLLWAGTDDGKVHITQDDGKKWLDLTPNVPGLPDWGTVTCIEASPHDAGTAFLVVDNHRMDDYHPYLWKTTDFGKTWKPISEGLDPGTHLKAVREDPLKKGLLYLGTERGVQYSPDSGKTWKSFQLNLPTVPVHDLKVKGNDLALATHGRSLWILDDLTAVRGQTDAAKKPIYLFPVAPATKWILGGGDVVSNHHRNSSSKNPEYGASIWYHFGPNIKGEAKLEIHNAQGKLVATAKGKFKPEAFATDDEEEDEDADPEKKDRKLPFHTGLNRFVWDLTYDGATPIPKAKVDSGNPAAGIPVAPGSYKVTITVGKQTVTGAIEVKPDVRRKVTPEEAKKQEEMALQLRDGLNTLSGTVIRLRGVQKQLALRKELWKELDTAKDLLKLETGLAKKLDDLEAKLHNPKAKVNYDIFSYRGGAMLYSQYVWLLGNLTSADGEPTKPQVELAAKLSKELASLVSDFEKLAKDDVGKVNEASKKLALPELFVSAPPKK